MGWFGDILNFFKSDPVREYKEVTAEIKELRDYHRAEAMEQRKINYDQNKRIEALEQELKEIKELEIRCLENYRILNEDYLITKEKLIFKTKGRHRDEEI